MECGNGYDADDYDFCLLLFLLIFCICGGWSISFVVRIDFNMIWQNGAYVDGKEGHRWNEKEAPYYV